MNFLESKRLTLVLELFISIALAVLFNTISSHYFFRIDLTEDNRYSISPATQAMLKNLDDDIYIEAYLDGELPAAFQRMKSSLHDPVILDKESTAGQAYEDVVSRFLGEDIPLRFVDVVPKKKGFFQKMFG